MLREIKYFLQVYDITEDKNFNRSGIHLANVFGMNTDELRTLIQENKKRLALLVMQGKTHGHEYLNVLCSVRYGEQLLQEAKT